MRERTLVYKDDDYDVEIVVRQASYGDGFRRYAIISREQARWKEQEEGGLADWNRHWAAFRVLPAFTCATVKIKNLDPEKQQLVSEMDLDVLLDLPEALVILWEKAVFECNPHWVPTPAVEDESGEAQEPGESSASTDDLSPGSKTKNQKTSPNGTSTT